MIKCHVVVLARILLLCLIFIFFFEPVMMDQAFYSQTVTYISALITPELVVFVNRDAEGVRKCQAERILRYCKRFVSRHCQILNHLNEKMIY